MICCDTQDANRAPWAGGGRLAFTFALWLCGSLLAQTSLADHAVGLDHPHSHHDFGAGSSIDWRSGESPEGKRIMELRARLAAHPSSPTVAAELARTYLELFRYLGDPGLLVLANDALAAWGEDADPPAAVALERAVLWQTEHRFSAALDMLERLVRREPRNARAWLTLAAVSKELGLHAKSRSACGQLLWLSDPVLGGACMASVLTATGHAEDAYSMLASVVGLPVHDLDIDVVNWMHSLAAEAAVVMNRPDLAETHLIAALEAAEHAGRPPEIYLLVEYADFLVAQSRSEEVLDLLARGPRAPSIMIREADARRSAAF